MFPSAPPHRTVRDVSLRWPLKGRNMRFGVIYLAAAAAIACVLWFALR